MRALLSLVGSAMRPTGLPRASVSYLAGIRAFLEGLVREAGIADAQDFARQWHILMKGSIVAAGEGDTETARRAKRIAAVLLDDAVARSRLPA